MKPAHILVLILLAGLIWAAAALAKVQHEVKLVYRVDGSPGQERLVLDLEQSTPQNCEQEPHPGCINVPKYYIGVIAFVLPGSDRKCSGGDEWKLTSVRLGGANRLTMPESKPSQWGNLEGVDGARAASDFGAKRDSGETRYQKRKRQPRRALDSGCQLLAGQHLVPGHRNSLLGPGPRRNGRRSHRQPRAITINRPQAGSYNTSQEPL